MTRRLSLKTIETSILGVVAFALSGAAIRVLATGGGDLVSYGDRRFEIFLAMLYASVMVIFLYHLVPGLRVAQCTPAIPALLLLAFLSAIWAEMPTLVLRRSAGVVGVTLFGIVLASRLTVDEQLVVFRRVFRTAAVLCIVAWVVGLALGLHLVTGSTTATDGIWSSDTSGPWRGIFNHKNEMGAAVAIGVLVDWYMPAAGFLAKVVKAAFICLYATLLLLSNSVTSAVALLFTFVIMQAFRLLRGRSGLAMPAIGVVLLFTGVFFSLNADSAIGVLGRSSDLSGRSALWEWATVMILKRPFLGYGFSGFWRGAARDSITVETHIGWSPMYSHNGYLEIMMSLGLAGLLLFGWMAIVGLRRAARLARNAEAPQDLWPLAFLVFFLLHNLAECTILWQNSLEWALCIATVASTDPRLNVREEPATNEQVLPDAFPECA